MTFILAVLKSVLGSVADSFLTQVFGLLKDEMNRRNLLEQGREQQHAADLEKTVTQAKEAASIDESVRALDDAGLDAGLERMRNASAPNH